jgi:hypothetical protein
MFTYFLIGAAVVLLVAVVVHQIRTRNTPGHHISQNAPMGSTSNNMAKFQSKPNGSSDKNAGGFGSVG